MVMRGVPEHAVSDTGRLAISMRWRLSQLFLDVLEEATGAPHIVIEALRVELLEIFQGGIFRLLASVETDNGDRYLSLFNRPTEFAFDRNDSVRLLGASLYGLTPTTLMAEIRETLVDLSLFTRSIYKVIDVTRGGPLRRYLWSQYRVVEQCMRELIRCEFIPYAPNARTGKKIPESVLLALAELIVHERSVLPSFINRVRNDSFAHDLLTSLRHSPILDLNGRAGMPGRKLSGPDVMDMLASSHPRHRRSLEADVYQLLHISAYQDFQARVFCSRGEGSPAIRLASDVIGVQTHGFIRALAGFSEGGN